MTERGVASLDGTGVVTEEKIKEIESREQRKARKARVLERGITIDRTTVELPAHLHGEWVPAGPVGNREGSIEVERARALGFEIDTQYATKRTLHSDGSSAPMVGDCIFMIIPKEEKELIDEVRNEQYERQHGKPGAPVHAQTEEKDYRAKMEISGMPTPIIEESTTRMLHKAELEVALKTKE